MSDVYQGSRADTGASQRPTAEALRGAAEAALVRSFGPAARRRPAPPEWTSSLCETDLACLMSVLESAVLPRLVRDYRPADGLPLRHCTD